MRRLASLVCLGLLLVPCGVCVLGPAAAAQETEFVRGDVNQDGRFSIADAVLMETYLFLGEGTIECFKAADVNDDSAFDIADQVRMWCLLNGVCSQGWEDVLPEPYPLPGVDPTPDSLTCDRYEPVETAEQSADVIRIGDAVAFPGATIKIPVYVSNSTPIHGFQIVIKTDLAAFEPQFGIDDEGSLVDVSGTILEEIGRHDPESVEYGAYRGPQFAAVGPVDDGEHFVVSAMFDYLPSASTLPPSTGERLFFKFVGTVPETVPGDTVIQLYPSNGVNGDGSGTFRLKNELCYQGEVSYASLLPQEFKGGKIAVKSSPDLLDYFMRGDSNSDGLLNIADPIYVITYLFARGSEPACADAADMNDDGTLDVADAIAGLTYLFGDHGTQSSGFAPNMGVCARDVAADDLPLCMYQHCPTTK